MINGMDALSIVQAQKRVPVDLLHLNVIVCRLGFVYLTGIIFERLPSREKRNNCKHDGHPNKFEHFVSACKFSQACQRNK